MRKKDLNYSIRILRYFKLWDSFNCHSRESGNPDPLNVWILLPMRMNLDSRFRGNDRGGRIKCVHPKYNP